MTEPPTFLGRQTDAETGYALVCNATPDGNPGTGALCGARAMHHIRWRQADTENSMACPDHLNMALALGPFDVHPVEDSACGIPGAHWVIDTPSRCIMPVLDVEPALAGAAAVGG